jgi:hypothetical protein
MKTAFSDPLSTAEFALRLDSLQPRQIHFAFLEERNAHFGTIAPNDPAFSDPLFRKQSQGLNDQAFLPFPNPKGRRCPKRLRTVHVVPRPFD